MFDFVQVGIDEFQHMTKNPRTVYRVVKVPGLYDEFWNLKETWEQLKSPNQPSHVDPVFTVTQYEELERYNGQDNFEDVMDGILLISDEVARIEVSFQDCNKLLGVVVPNSVIEGYVAEMYRDCTSLQFFENSDSMIEVPRSCFEGCELLKKMHMGNNISNIDERAFYGCRSLSDLVLPDTLYRIWGEAFYDCSSLETLTIPAGTRLIYQNVFPTTINSIQFESPTGWAIYEDIAGKRKICDIDLSNSLANPQIFNTHAEHYFMK